MADHGQSSDQNVSVTRPTKPSGDRPSTLPIRPIMTQLRFEYSVVDYGTPIALLHKGKEREIIEMVAGQALSDTLRAIS